MQQSWSDIKAHFPDEYVVVLNPQFAEDAPLELSGGEVVGHSADLDDLLNDSNLSGYNHYVIRYTGDLGRAIGERGMLRVIEQG